MKIIKRTIKGNFTVQLSERDVKWVNGKEFKEYTVSRLHNTRAESVGDSIRTYKRIETAEKRYQSLTA